MKSHWKKCEPGWWDAMRKTRWGMRYTGWSVAWQIWKRRRGWYCFNDALNKMIGPFKTPEQAMEAKP